MSRILGDFGEILTQSALRPVSIRALSKPVVLATGRIIVPSSVTTQTDSNGKIDVWLAMGDYEVTCGEAKFTVSILDDNLTYQLYQRIVSAVVYAPTTPVGGAQPNASATVLGLVKTHVTEAIPIVPTYDEMVDYVAAHSGSGTYRGTAALFAGSGSPEGVVTGNPGDIYIDLANPAALRMFTKATGTATNTGWS